jgi:purine-nucleoside phosphorylase
MIEMETLEKAAKAVMSRWPNAKPRCAITLGSGWGEVLEVFDLRDTLDYADIPGMGVTGVAGHVGRLVLASAGEMEILIFQGRRHWYEGVGWTPIALPIYIAKSLGVEICILTNAAGGIARGMKAGDLMIIEDHINMLGTNPLIGTHNPFWGPRFPDQSSIYDADLRRRMANAAALLNRYIHTGVYLATTGPTFETPAEISACRQLGADAVGMSTVPEAILANAAGLRVAGLSCITNLAAGISPVPLTHQEVIEISRREMPNLRNYLSKFFEECL